MMWHTHIAVGGAVGGALAQAGAIPVDPLTLSALAVGSLLPDVDEPRSYAGSRVPILSWPLKAIFGHRGVTHSAACLAALSASAFAFLPWEWATAFAAAYAGHLAADAVSGGVPFLWPSDARQGVALVSTGGFAEKLLVFPLCVAASLTLVGGDPIHLARGAAIEVGRALGA
ncbi:hypothetical protein CKO28_13380 [Rhodovibrio sodomensis]|uniref:Metal-dependent hydrolase n=1 Tax=Rhodovibrio sodomensis TaxID=1088 RepID=A0ABS1DEX9_9PROT|nr:metal-dependent hydrolase [Rhodovibrio sodomensis]MBK1669024.1 hypothetical protein [Rhodovibrio sodomensis]